MKKTLGVAIFVLAVVPLWLMWPREKPLPRTEVSEAAKSVKPAHDLSQPLPAAAVQDARAREKTTTTSASPILVPEMTFSSVPKPGQKVNADGVVTEEIVDAPDGKGKLTKRYTYADDGRLSKTISIDEAGMVEVWNYRYDVDGKASIQVIDANGNVSAR